MKSAATVTDILACLFNGTPLPDYGTDLQINLHISDPGSNGTASTNAADYTGYAPVTVARSAAGFTVSGNQATNAADVSFPECTGGSNQLTHASVSIASGQILYSGPLPAPVTVSNLMAPRFPAGSLVMVEA